MNGDVLDWVEVFKYLGHMLSQDDNDTQAVQAQVVKTRKCWDCVGKVLRSKNASPHVCGYFYKAVIQGVLLFGSETWNLTPVLLTQLEGFHIRCGYWIAREHKPKCGPGNNWA